MPKLMPMNAPPPQRSPLYNPTGTPAVSGYNPYGGVWAPPPLRIQGPIEVMRQGLNDLDLAALLGAVALATGVHLRIGQVIVEFIPDDNVNTGTSADENNRRQASGMLNTAFYTCTPKKTIDTEMVELAKK